MVPEVRPDELMSAAQESLFRSYALAGEDAVRRSWKFLPRNPLVVVQIAFSLALLTAAALFIRGASKAASVDTGLRPGASYLLETDASLAGYEPKRAEELYLSLNERLGALPGVDHTSITATVPFGMISLGKNVQRAGLRPGSDAKPATAAGSSSCPTCVQCSPQCNQMLTQRLRLRTEWL